MKIYGIFIIFYSYNICGKTIEKNMEFSKDFSCCGKNNGKTYGIFIRDAHEAKIIYQYDL
jgi:hypothetical protein